MKLLFDFFPIFLFFIAFKFFGIYIATAVTMLGSLLQVGIYACKYGKFEILHLITLGIVIIMGGTTLLLHNELFIKWKPTAVFGIFALTALGSQFIGKKPLAQHLLGAKIDLPTAVWRQLNLSWVAFFSLMAIINIYVLYHFSTNAWVNFKLFGFLGMTIVFLIVQAIYIARYLQTGPTNTAATSKNSPS